MYSVEKKCLNCGQTFVIESSRMKREPAKYCSRKCYGIARRGIPLPEKTKLALSKSLKGRICSEETKQKMSKAQLGKKTYRIPWNKGLFGVVKVPQTQRDNHYNWKGGKYLHNGYMLVMQKGHHRQNVKGYVLEHILVAEKYLNRPITKNEYIHHINGDKLDNRPENLYLFSSKSAHHKLHQNPLLKNTILISNII